MTISLKPGVVTGKDYLALVKACKDGQYALPAVNVIGTNTINAVLEAAAKNKSDVVIQLSNGGAEFYAGKGFPDSFQAKVLGAVSAAHHVHMLAEHYGVCVIMHTDHANKKLIPWVEAMLTHGEAYYKHMAALFSQAIWLTCPKNLSMKNIHECARLLKRMAAIDMSIEIELGCTGGEEDGVGSDDIDNARLYTQPKMSSKRTKPLPLSVIFQWRPLLECPRSLRARQCQTSP
jgi:fructose-bisphosphate aldolase class II